MRRLADIDEQDNSVDGEEIPQILGSLGIVQTYAKQDGW
jgi:hypothetical protein